MLRRARTGEHGHIYFSCPNNHIVKKKARFRSFEKINILIQFEQQSSTFEFKDRYDAFWTFQRMNKLNSHYHDKCFENERYTGITNKNSQID